MNIPLVSTSGLATILSVFLSFSLIVLHCRYYSVPTEQKYIIIIILMAPIFAVNCWVGLFLVNEEDAIGYHLPEWVDMALDSIKECYEAVVIWAFLRLMFSYMNISDIKHIPDKLEGKHIHHSMPFKYFMSDIELNTESVAKLESWALQFVLLRPILSILTLVLELSGSYDKLWAWLPITIVLNISLTVAMYALMLFYHAFEQELSLGKQRPLAKFLSIKGVVAFAFWQGIMIKLLLAFGLISVGKFCSAAEQKTVYQDFLVCMEMGLLFSPLQFYAFTHSTYKEKNKQKSE
mmetsp:Transcript_455/g.598  ORF Transcript_455/g.598 Transcript_455/m.598 type:complete len:292 (+) Transcript_455:79-954(+)